MEEIRSEPECGNGLQILLVGTGNMELSSSFDAQNIASSRPRFNLFNERRVDQDGTVDADEAEGPELFRHARKRLPEQLRTGRLPEQNAIALGLHRLYAARIDQ